MITLAEKIEAREDLYFFSRLMFFKRRGFKWLQSWHHKVICDALMRVYTGECKRLIINIPPRYSKTELAVVNFIAWTLGKVPDAEFIHASYSGSLTQDNSGHIQDLVTHEAYQEIFPDIALANEAKEHWRTTKGGVLFTTSTGGKCTGFGAGKQRGGFGGCFPYDQIIETEDGPFKIGDIVTKKMQVRVWSYNETTGEKELKPIDTFWTNPGNDIVKVHLSNGETFRCTPDHKILTTLGWVSAIELSESFDLVQGEPCFIHRLRPCFGGVNCYIDDILGRLRSVIPSSIRKIFCNAGPCFSGLDLAYNSLAYTVPFGEDIRRRSTGEYFNGYGSGKFRPWPSFEKGKCTVSDRILHVIGLASPCEIFESIVSAIAVQMPSLISRHGAFANKGLKNKVGNITQSDFSEDRETDTVIPLTVFTRPNITRGGCPFNISEARNLIKPVSVGDNYPLFVESFGHVEVTFCLEVRDNHNFILSQSGAIVKNCIILDDPHKADEARSETMRNNAIYWFQNTLESRKNDPKNTPIILIMQRLHENDLAGWLLNGGNGEKWEHICLPAIQPDGSALWPAKHSIEALQRMQEAAPYTFAGQYQQRPSPAEGGIFKPGSIEVIDAIPAGQINWVRGWDLASTAKGDYTVGLKLGKTQEGRFIIGDIVRVRSGPDERDYLIKNTASFDGGRVKISIPQDPGQAGKSQVLYLTRALSGFRVISSPETGDKVTRAEMAAAQLNVGNVQMLRGSWNYDFIEELRMFPNGTFDDQVDAFSRAFSDLIGARRMIIGEEAMLWAVGA